MIDNGIVNPAIKLVDLLINTNKIRVAAMILEAKKTVISSFCPVCLTTPLYDPLIKKEAIETTSTTGI
tara:strand:+ start:85 stop:288 length:204 start_codon:yes stop_codon:yes gene_type:complete